MKVAIPWAKYVLAPLETRAGASAINTRIQKQIHDSGRPLFTASIISNKEMNDMIKIVQAIQDSKISLKAVTKAIKNETKEQKDDF